MRLYGCLEAERDRKLREADADTIMGREAERAGLIERAENAEAEREQWRKAHHNLRSSIDSEIAATIERCAVVVRKFRATTPNAQSIEEAIRALAKPAKEQPDANTD
jgi:hypothetical protein